MPFPVHLHFRPTFDAPPTCKWRMLLGMLFIKRQSKEERPRIWRRSGCRCSVNWERKPRERDTAESTKFYHYHHCRITNQPQVAHPLNCRIWISILRWTTTTRSECENAHFCIHDITLSKPPNLQPVTSSVLTCLCRRRDDDDERQRVVIISTIARGLLFSRQGDILILRPAKM